MQHIFYIYIYTYTIINTQLSFTTHKNIYIHSQSARVCGLNHHMCAIYNVGKISINNYNIYQYDIPI